MTAATTEADVTTTEGLALSREPKAVGVAQAPRVRVLGSDQPRISTLGYAATVS